jgi:hypothetical protein
VFLHSREAAPIAAVLAIAMNLRSMFRLLARARSPMGGFLATEADWS